MYYKLLLILFVCSLSLPLHSQKKRKSPCYNIYNKAANFYKGELYDEALKVLKDLELCDFNDDLQTERLTLRDKILEAIKKQKDEAFEAEKAAVAARGEAESKTEQNERLSRSSRNALKTLDMIETDPTKALRLAELNYHLFPESQSAAGILKIHLSDTRKAKFKNSLNLTNNHQEGHTDDVNAVAYSSTGDLILTGSDDGLAILWDNNGKLLTRFVDKDSAEINTVAFSPDDKRILTGAENGNTVLWDLNGKALQYLKSSSVAVHAATFSSDGNAVLTGTSDGNAKLWNLKDRTVRVFKGVHSGAVLAVDMSPDGKHVLTGSADGTAILWSIEGKAKVVLAFHYDYVTSVAFSPDGQYILTGSDDETAILFNLEGERVRTFEGHVDYVTSVAFSPDGKYVLTGADDGTAIIWALDEDTEGNEEFEEGIMNILEMDNFVKAVSFSPNGRYVLLGLADGSARQLDLEGHVVETFSGHKPNLMTFSPDGQKLLAAVGDERVKLWDLSQEELKEESFDIPQGDVQAIAFSPDSKWILIGCTDSVVRIWDLKGKELYNFRFNTIGKISALAVSEDHQYLLTGFNNGKVNRKPILGGEPITYTAHHDTISVIAFVPNKDGNSWLTGSHNGDTRLWTLPEPSQSAATNKPTAKPFSIKGQHSPIKALAVSPAGDLILTGSEDGTARLWNCSDESSHPSPIQSFLGHTESLRDVDFSPNGTQILISSQDGKAKLWDIQGSLLKEFIGHKEDVLASSLSSDGKQVLTASRDWTIKTWDITDVKSLSAKGAETADGEVSAIYDVAFFPEKQWVLTGSADGKAILWDAEGNQKKQFIGAGDTISAVTFSADGKEILTGSKNGSVKLWNVEATGTEIKAFTKEFKDRDNPSHKGTVNSVVFSKDGKYILSGSSDGTAKLWDKKTGKVRKRFQAHTASVNSAIFTPKGEILTGSSDGTVILWNFSGGAPKNLYTLFSGEIFSVAISPDGQYILAGTEEGLGIRWPFNNPEEAMVFGGSDGHSDWVRSVAFTPDGQSILTASDDMTAKLWSLESGQLINTFYGHNGYVLTVMPAPSPCPEGENCDYQILTCSDDGTAILWSKDANNNKIYPKKNEDELLTVHTAEISVVSLSSDRQKVLTGYVDGTLILSDLEKGNRIEFDQKYRKAVTAVSISPNGKQVLVGYEDGKIFLWNSSGKKKEEFKQTKSKRPGNTTNSTAAKAVNAVAFSPEGDFILAGSEDGMARLWDIKKKDRPQTEFQGQHTKAIRTVAFSANGEEVLTGSADGKARLWNRRGKELITFTQESSPARRASSALKSYEDSPIKTLTVSHNHDRKVFVTGHEDGNILLWEYEFGWIKQQINDEGVDGEEGKSLASAGDGDAKSEEGSDIQKSEPTQKSIRKIRMTKAPIKLERKSISNVNDIAFSEDGKLILAGFEDGLIKLFDLNGHLIQIFRDKNIAIQTVEFSEKGGELLTVSIFDNLHMPGQDWRIKTWETPSTFLKGKVATFTLDELKKVLKTDKKDWEAMIRQWE